MIYVLCPYELVTGGPDALHQLVYYLNKNFINSEIVYCDIHNYDMKIPKVYQCYVNSYKLIKDILDSEENVVIMPETLWFYGSKFMKCKKILWWLSVDNNAKNSCLFLKLFLVFKKVFSRRF